MPLKFVFAALLALLLAGPLSASKLLIPMDDAQSNHLKAYGIAFWCCKTTLRSSGS